jgi:hypothetical protein
MAGRPWKYKTAKEMQEIIDEYFKECDGKLYTIKDVETGEEKAVLDKYGNPVIVGQKPYTITGLALALGLNSRQALLNYQGREEFNDTVTRAKAKVEEYAESRLFDKDGANGAKFSLANNFRDWRDKQDVELTGRNGGPIELSADLPPEALEAVAAAKDMDEVKAILARYKR